MVSKHCLYRLGCLWFALAFVAACGDSNPIGPSNQPEVANNPDNFQFQASNLTSTSQTLTYSWVNTGTAANVDQSGAISSGQATVTLRDAANALVYSGDLRNTGTFISSSGGSGTWRIEVRLTDVTGMLNFRVQKRS
ncbi:MAG TPA: hypothetical protein VFO58_24065 [Vicinamibacterales bacterium]|nr:hypothetical protein [Vicinamibacterales bacterium]